jgi:hypothetical protein
MNNILSWIKLETGFRNELSIFNLNNIIQNYRRHWIHHAESMEYQYFPKQLMDSGASNTIIDYKPILKYLIFGLFYFRPTTCFDYQDHHQVVFMKYVSYYRIIMMGPFLYLILNVFHIILLRVLVTIDRVCIGE